MKKIIIILLALPLCIQTVVAQKNNNRKERETTTNSANNEPRRHEVTGWINGGFSSLQYSPKVGDHTGGIGGELGVGYTYSFNPKWGISTGLGVGLYNAKTRINGHFDTYAAIDDEEEYNKMNLLVDIDQFEEKQQAYLLNIPLMLQFQAAGNETNTFYAALGGKISIPIHSKYKSTGNYITKGKYAFTETIFEDMPEHGYNTYDRLKENRSLKMNLNVQLAAEVGYKWLLNEDWFLYTGVYCDYGLNDIRKNKDNALHVLEYNRQNPIRYGINSIAESSYSNGKENGYYLKKMNTISLGLKVKVAFKID